MLTDSRIWARSKTELRPQFLAGIWFQLALRTYVPSPRWLGRLSPADVGPRGFEQLHGQELAFLLFLFLLISLMGVRHFGLSSTSLLLESAGGIPGVETTYTYDAGPHAFRYFVDGK